jgi:hypothetical protein
MKSNSFKLHQYAFFCQRWDEISDVVEYESCWEKPIDPNRIVKKSINSEGVVRDLPELIPYSLDNIHMDETLQKLAVGSAVKSMDDHGRKIIVVVTRLGLVVVHMVSPSPKGIEIAANASNRLKWSGVLPQLVSSFKLAELIGSPKGVQGNKHQVYRNLGESLELTAKILTDPNYNPGHSVRRVKNT